MGKTPSFKDCVPVSSVTSYVKSRNRSHDTQAELMLRRALWRMGLRYRKNVSELPGKPDIVISRARVVVFCDGDFWHGRNWETLRSKLEQGANARYWPAKIARNIERDREHDARLAADGWHVVRVWETDVKRNPDAVAAEIIKIVTAGSAEQSPSTRIDGFQHEIR